MDRLKRFKWYLIIFLFLFLSLYFLTEGTVIRKYKSLRYEVDFETPILKISKAKTTYTHGYIEGTITNNTGELINLKYLNVEYYNNEGTYLGVDHKEVELFNVDEEMKFKVEYNYNEVDYVKISFTDEKTEKQKHPIEQVVDSTIEITRKVSPLVKILTALFLIS